MFIIVDIYQLYVQLSRLYWCLDRVWSCRSFLKSTQK